MRYTSAMVQYYEVIDNETGLTVEKYNTAAEAEAVADILNRSGPTPQDTSTAEGEPEEVLGDAPVIPGKSNEPTRPFATRLEGGVPYWEDMTEAEIKTFKTNGSSEQQE